MKDCTTMKCATAVLALLAASLASCADSRKVVRTTPSTESANSKSVPNAQSVHATVSGLAPFAQKVAGTAYEFQMIPIPGDPSQKIAPFWIGQTELGWEAFDAFVYGADLKDAKERSDADAITRPTKPYLPPDRGFGHEGYAAISMSYKNAATFCEWLSKKSGKHYRLPTEAEWELACRAGSKSAYSFGDDVKELADYAWFKDNGDNKTHPIAQKKPNAFGLFDMHGNVLEWCTDAAGQPIAKGGSYNDEAPKLAVSARAKTDPAWNRSDPQIPKSKWWLSDGPFVGFRVVCESDPTNAGVAGK